MNDNLLREDGGAWQAPPAPPLDLDRALARSRDRRARLTSGAALVAVVAVAAGVALLRPANLVPAVPAGTPTASASPSLTPTPTGPLPLPQGGALAAGSYLIDATSPAAAYSTIQLTVPAGWAVDNGRIGTGLGGPGEVSVSFWNPLGAYTDGCSWRAAEVMRYLPDETGWFAHFPRAASDATQVRLGGRPALRVELSVTADLDPTGCDDGEYRSWYEWSGRVDANHAAGQTDVAYLIDIDGVGLLVDAVSRPGSAADDLADLAAVLDSLVIGPAPSATEARLARAALAHVPLGGALPSVTGGRAVETTLGEARRVLDSGELGAGASGTPVWLIQLDGGFDCSTCPRPAGDAGPTGTVFTVLLDPDLSREYGVALANTPVPLAGLGTVTEFAVT